MSGIHPQLTVMLRKAHNPAVRQSAELSMESDTSILHPFIFSAANFSMNVWYSFLAHCYAAQSAQCGSKTKHRAKHGERHIKTRRLRLLKILHPFLSSSSFPIQTSEKLEATARVSQKVNP